jgi:hypothetical protein
MTSTTDVSPPADDSGVTSQQPESSQPRPSRLNQALAWVGIVAGGLFIVAAIFFSGFFLSSSLGGPSDEHMGPGHMACCSQMKPDEHMKPGAMMPPGSQMAPREVMPSGMMGPDGMTGPAVHSPATTTPSTPRP